MTTEARVKEIIAEQLGVELEQVTDYAHIYDDLGADSLDQVELVLALEEEYDIEIDDVAVEDYLIVCDIVAKIKDLIN